MSEEKLNPDPLAIICKIFGNRNRIKIVHLLKKRPCTFGDLLRELQVNPKVLNDNLNMLSTYELVEKPSGERTYALTSNGQVAKEGLDVFRKSISTISKIFEKKHIH